MIALGPEVRKHFFLGAALLIVAERQSGFFLDCRVGRWAPWSTLAVECGAASIALDIHLEDGRVMDQAVDRCQRHSLVREHLAPFTEWPASSAARSDFRSARTTRSFRLDPC